MSDAPKIAQALSAVMADVQAVGKDSTNKTQGYRFRGIDAVVNEVGPAFRKHGVICLPTVEEIAYAVIEVGKDRTRMRECTVRVRYTFHGPAGDSIECVSVGEAMDSGDKATPKAMSVAYRVALLQALCIPTDDPDADAQSYERSPKRSPAKLQSIETAIGAARNEAQLKIAWEMVPEAVEAGEITDDEAQRMSDLVKKRRVQMEASPAADASAPDKAKRRMYAMFRERGIVGPDQHELMSAVVERQITSSNDLTAAEIDAVIKHLEHMKVEPS